MWTSRSLFIRLVGWRAGKQSQMHMDPMAVIKPGQLEQWFTEEARFFRLLPGHDCDWHCEGVHVITSGTGAAGRNFEIGEHSEEGMEKLYPPEMYGKDDLHRVRLRG